MVKIRIKELKLRTYIGFNPEERQKKQDVTINICFQYDAEKAAESDDVESAVNYKTITKQIIKFVEENQFLLLEKMTSDICQLILENKNIQFVEVEVDKPHALRFADSVSATVSHSR
jgi:D-erythro-7,8-dihydroneopterin triphosphate epimerase